jgi:hypothetical protein
MLLDPPPLDFFSAALTFSAFILFFSIFASALSSGSSLIAFLVF